MFFKNQLSENFILNKLKFKKISKLTAFIIFFSLLFGFLLFLTGIYGIYNSYKNNESKPASASTTEPNYCGGGNNPVYNSNTIITNSNNPLWNDTTKTCYDLPLLSFWPINTNANNPREITIGAFERVVLQVYYINSANPNSASITNPNVKIKVEKVTNQKYKISATLSGSNTTTITSAQKGGDLYVNLPINTRLEYTQNSTHHFIDAIERLADANSNGTTPYDVVPDNNGFNPIYSMIDGFTLPSTNGYNFKPQGLEAGYLGYGYILSEMKAKYIPNSNPQNNPPSIPGEEITIKRGESGNFKPLAPTDPEQHHPISLDTTRIPSFCRLTGSINNIGGGQIISCQTNAQTPVKTTFTITPTDSLGLIGTPGTFIINVIDENQPRPDINIVKNCYQRGTNNNCSSINLKSGSNITYKITITNTGNQNLSNVKLIDDYDETKLKDIINISDNGEDNIPSNGKITWNLSNFGVNQSKTFTFDATIKDNLNDGTTINNIATVKTDQTLEKSANYNFNIGGTVVLELTKKCFKKGTQTNCSAIAMYSKDIITYQIILKNIGSKKAINIQLVDTYNGTYLTNINSINPTGNHNNTNFTITWNLSEIQPQDSKTFTFDATIKDNVVNGTSIENVVVAKSEYYPDLIAKVNFNVTVINTETPPRTGNLNIKDVSLTVVGIITFMITINVYFLINNKNSKEFNKNK